MFVVNKHATLLEVCSSGEDALFCLLYDGVLCGNYLNNIYRVCILKARAVMLPLIENNVFLCYNSIVAASSVNILHCCQQNVAIAFKNEIMGCSINRV